MIRDRFDAVVFDLDGTLIDSEPDLRQALNKTLLQFGREPVERKQVIMMIGDGIKNIFGYDISQTHMAARNSGN